MRAQREVIPYDAIEDTGELTADDALGTSRVKAWREEKERNKQQQEHTLPRELA